MCHLKQVKLSIHDEISVLTALWTLLRHLYLRGYNSLLYIWTKIISMIMFDLQWWMYGNVAWEGSLIHIFNWHLQSIILTKLRQWGLCHFLINAVKKKNRAFRKNNRTHIVNWLLFSTLNCSLTNKTKSNWDLVSLYWFKMPKNSRWKDCHTLYPKMTEGLLLPPYFTMFRHTIHKCNSHFSLDEFTSQFLHITKRKNHPL